MVDLQSLVTTFFSPEDRLSVGDFPQRPGERRCPGISPHLCLGAPNLTRQGLRRGHSRPLLLLSAAQRISLYDGVGGCPGRSWASSQKSFQLMAWEQHPRRKLETDQRRALALRAEERSDSWIMLMIYQCFPNVRIGQQGPEFFTREEPLPDSSLPTAPRNPTPRSQGERGPLQSGRVRAW